MFYMYSCLSKYLGFVGPVRSEPVAKVRDEKFTADAIQPASFPKKETATSAELRRSPTAFDCKKVLDYDTELKKHGWKMEIPGDPLGLK